jgi:hypothetical protein
MSNITTFQLYNLPTKTQYWARMILASTASLKEEASLIEVRPRENRKWRCMLSIMQN